MSLINNLKLDTDELNDEGDHTILIVDDLEENVAVLNIILKRRKYKIFKAYNGLEAIEIATKEIPDLVLLDINMPGMNGKDVVKELRKNDITKNIGIILLTAASGIEELIEGFAAGADDFLQKPYQHVEMLARIRAALRLRDSQLQLVEANSKLDSVNQNLQKLVNEQVNELEKTNRLRRYFSPQVADAFMCDSSEPFQVDIKKNVSVLFLDLRNFTAFADNFPLETVMSTLKEFHNTVGPIIFEYHATLERFTGDGLMCFLGAPNDIPEHARLALEMSRKIHESLKPLVKEWHKKSYNLSLGIGIASGEAATGAIGFKERLDYACIGPVTNLAARLCSLAKGGDSMIACSTIEQLTTKETFKHVDKISIKGFSETFKVYQDTP